MIIIAYYTISLSLSLLHFFIILRKVVTWLYFFNQEGNGKRAISRGMCSFASSNLSDVCICFSGFKLNVIVDEMHSFAFCCPRCFSIQPFLKKKSSSECFNVL